MDGTCKGSARGLFASSFDETFLPEAGGRRKGLEEAGLGAWSARYLDL